MRTAIAFVVFACASAQAQSLRGKVTEIGAGQPIAGAAILVLDASGAVMSRAVSGANGEYIVRRPADANVLRTVRMGFRPIEFRGGKLPSDGELAIAMEAIPKMLQPVIGKTGATCPKRKDREIAFGFWEQAKASLIASVIARESNPADYTTYSYLKTPNNRDSIVSQRVRRDSGRWTNSYSAAFDAAEFVSSGFVRKDSIGRMTFLGPDAEVLLENEFQDRYCFSIADGDASRPKQVGLRFIPAKGRPNTGRVDIDGTLWIDTAQRQLKDIQYKYVELAPGADRYRPGGSVVFKELDNSIPFVASWNIRMLTPVVSQMDLARMQGKPVATRRGYAGDFAETATRNTAQFDVMHGGGVVGHVRWENGKAFDGALGRVRIRAMHDDGTPVANQAITLDSTMYGGVTDSNGVLVLNDLVPGPYQTVIVDTTLDVIGLKLRSSLNFVAEPDTIVDAALFIRDAASALARSCEEKSYTGWAMFVARVADSTGKPIADINWAMGNKFGKTLANGVILPCMKNRIGQKFEMGLWYDRGFPNDERPHIIEFELKDIVTAIKVTMPPNTTKPPPLPSPKAPATQPAKPPLD